VPIKPLTANVTGSPYGVPTGSTALEPQIKDQTTIDGVKTAITAIPTSYLVIGGVSLAVLGVVFMVTRRPA